MLDNMKVSFPEIENEAKNKIFLLVKDFSMFEDIDKSVNSLADSLMSELLEVSKNFKWVVNCFILESGSATCTMHSSSFWDEELDGTINLEFKKDRFIVRIVVYCFAL